MARRRLGGDTLHPGFRWGRSVARPWLVALAVGTLAAAAPRVGSADPAPAPADQEHPGKLAVLLPTVIVDGAVRRLPTATEPDLVVIAGGLDALLSDTAQDLGLVVDLTQRGGRNPARLGERDLAAEAQTLGGWVIAPSVARDSSQFELRIVLAEAGSRSLRVRVERVAREDVSVRAVIMLRDLIDEAGRRPSSSGRSRAAEGAPGLEPGGGPLATPARSAGRATLVVNATMFGGLAGYSVQRSSGSDDPRLLYPLLAVGAGIGLGGSIIVAEEWDVGLGDAWFLAAGAWWPTLAGHLIWEGRFGDTSPADERWAMGLVSGTVGISIATTWLTLGGVAEGGAMVAHSGGGLGLIFGGLTELFYHGDIYNTPFAGMGYGAAFGWLVASAVAPHIHVPTSRVLTVDLGAVLGGLAGAALASPLLFNDSTQTQQRLWLGATAGAALIGGGIAWYATRQSTKSPPRTREHRAEPSGEPMLGVVGESRVGSASAPIYGLGWRGTLR